MQRLVFAARMNRLGGGVGLTGRGCFAEGFRNFSCEGDRFRLFPLELRQLQRDLILAVIEEDHWFFEEQSSICS